MTYWANGVNKVSGAAVTLDLQYILGRKTICMVSVTFSSRINLQVVKSHTIKYQLIEHQCINVTLSYMKKK